jgi:hypothetical protein
VAAAIQTSALTDTVVETCRNLNETDLHLKGQSSAPVTVLDKGGRGSHFCSTPSNSPGRGWALQYASEELRLPARSSGCRLLCGYRWMA